MIRRQLFRNERSLYKTMCALCGKNIISMYAPENGYTVYCVECYASDRWNPHSYAKEYDFSRPFFEQLGELFRAIPRRAMYQDFATGSEYTNYAVYMKNCYFTFGGHHYEDCRYCAQNFYLTNCGDVDFSMRSELCYESLHLRRCSRVFYSSYSEDCADSWFLFGCRNCHDCIGCTNLRNAKYCIFNEEYTKEEYAKKKQELKLDTRTGIDAAGKRAVEKSLNFPRKYAWVRNTVNSTGDDLEQTKECVYCFSATEDENCRYSFFVPTGAKDTYDVDHVAMGTQDTYELHSGFGNNMVAFGNRVYDSHHVYYSDDCYNSAYLFGCAGLRKKEYCILNKQYAKEEYAKLVPKIRAHMQEQPHKEPSGNTFSFGEYFPPSIMPFAYNECVTQEYFPLTKDGALQRGFRWRDAGTRSYNIAVEGDALPETVSEVQDDILEKIIGCAHAGTCNHQCSTAFRIIPAELQFLRQFNLPMPRLCPNCRHLERLEKRNSLSLVQRICDCNGAKSKRGEYANTKVHVHGANPCPNTFESPLSPDRPEIVYCESCYQAEVV
jgi:CxxC-x17-CxxC domain-containing protein